MSYFVEFIVYPEGLSLVYHALPHQVKQCLHQRLQPGVHRAELAEVAMVSISSRLLWSSKAMSKRVRCTRPPAPGAPRRKAPHSFRSRSSRTPGTPGPIFSRLSRWMRSTANRADPGNRMHSSGLFPASPPSLFRWSYAPLDTWIRLVIPFSRTIMRSIIARYPHPDPAYRTAFGRHGA